MPSARRAMLYIIMLCEAMHVHFSPQFAAYAMLLTLRWLLMRFFSAAYADMPHAAFATLLLLRHTPCHTDALPPC